MYPTPHKSLYQLLGLSITISITLIPCFLCSSPHEPHYANCSQPFRCGADPRVLGDLRYPFWGINRGSYCGEPGFELKCVNNTPIITNSTYNLRVIGTNPKYGKMTVAMADFSHTLCPSSVLSRKLTNVSILELSSGSLSMDSSHSYSLLTILYGCPPELGHQLSWSRRYPCSSTNDSVGVHFVTHTVNISLTSGCLDVAVLPILQESAQSLDDDLSSLVSVLDQGFDMKWFTLQDSNCKSCMGSGGQCGFDRSKTLFTCYCPDTTYPHVCPPSIRGMYAPTLYTRFSYVTTSDVGAPTSEA